MSNPAITTYLNLQYFIKFTFPRHILILLKVTRSTKDENRK